MSKPKKSKSTKKLVSDIIFGVLMGFFGLIILFSIIEKTVGFSISGYHVMWVKTNSMESTIPAQSYILVKDAKDEEIQPGTIITFVSEAEGIKGQLNTHRVIQISAQGEYVTKGDNSPFQDYPPVKPENVKYVYQKNLPFLTFFGRQFATPYGYAITVALIGGSVAVWFAIDYKDRKKEEKQELMDKMVKEEVERLENEAKNKENKN